MNRHHPLVLYVFKPPFYTVLYVSTGSITVLLLSNYIISFWTVQFHRSMTQFLFHTTVNWRASYMASLDIEMMCFLYWTLLYDHIVINVMLPEDPWLVKKKNNKYAYIIMLFHHFLFERKLLFTRINVHETVKFFDKN